MTLTYKNRRITRPFRLQGSSSTKEKRNDTPISAKKDIMGDKTVRVRADLHHIIKIETAKNGGNVKEVMEIRLRSKLKSVLIVQYLKILYNRN
ncbi:peptide-binding protein [Bacillus subtilis]